MTGLTSAQMAGIIRTGSITRLPSDAAGRVVVAGSHGGAYPARLAIAARLRAVILHDAGIGLDRAGIASLALCDAAGMAAATVAAATARIGDADDMLARGVISLANRHAMECGVLPGESAARAARILAGAALPPVPSADPEGSPENRTVRPLAGTARRLVLVDSASLVRAEDAGQIIVTGSHGGMFGADPALALAADGFAAFYNDAGGGADDWGMSRLPVLDGRGIAAATVAAASARIGEAHSTWQDGVLSAVNTRAHMLGLGVGQPCREAVTLLARQ